MPPIALPQENCSDGKPSVGKKLFIKGNSETIHNENAPQRSHRARNERPQSHHFVLDEEAELRAGSSVSRINMGDFNLNMRRGPKQSAHHSRGLAPPMDFYNDLDGMGDELMMNGRSNSPLLMPPGARDLPLPRPLEVGGTLSYDYLTFRIEKNW